MEEGFRAGHLRIVEPPVVVVQAGDEGFPSLGGKGYRLLGETDGREYFFITREEFERRILDSDFLEHAEYAGNLYGTPKSWVYSLLNTGKDVILEIEVQGAQQVMQNEKSCVSVFILPPSIEKLETRLRNRGTEDEATVQKRLNAAKAEIERAPLYDYRIVNDQLEAAYRELKNIYLQHAGFMKA